MYEGSLRDIVLGRKTQFVVGWVMISDITPVLIIKGIANTRAILNLIRLEKASEHTR